MRIKFPLSCPAGFMLVYGLGPLFTAGSAVAQETSSVTWPQVREILEKNCLECHGGQQVRSGFRLSNGETFRKGGDRGPVVRADRPQDSRFLRIVGYGEPDLAMPPAGKLPDSEIEILRSWVLEGANWPDDKSGELADPLRFPDEESHAPSVEEEWWAYQPLREDDVPVSGDPDWNQHPVDAFIRSQLDEQGLIPAPAATPLHLLRRAHFDLLGLPPTTEETDLFLREVEAIGKNQAWIQLLDRLLARPQYGEHWARHWLDLVRYAETNGYERDGTKTNIWRYRDWVIRALNADLPYDEFLTHQLAGDELPDSGDSWPSRADTDNPILATGYYRLGVWDDEPADRPQARADELADIVDTTGQVFLATTVGCARCHDHKADPISQKDYYSLTAVFNNVSGYGGGNFGQHLGGGMTHPVADLPQDGVLTLEERQLQVTAVEEELQVYVDRFRHAATAEGRDFKSLELVADARSCAATWRYHTGLAPDGWSSPGFNDKAWKIGKSGFGTQGTPGAVVATVWDKPLIFLRIRFALTDIPDALVLSFHHDEDVTVYLNGVQVFEKSGYRRDYSEVQLPSEAIQALVVGSNVLAVGCKQTGGGQFIDVGLRTGWLEEGNAPWLIRLAAEGERYLEPRDVDQVAELLRERDKLSQLPVVEPYPALVVSENGRESPAQHVMLRGSAHALGDVVEPGVPVVLSHTNSVTTAPWESASVESPSTGRRLAFARWLVGDGNFLTARVMANRLWQFHFGRGLCRSAGDFGRLGEKPTHAALLDHLATELIRRHWSLKEMHRYLMTSRAYQMNSVGGDPGRAKDPRNDFYWRFDPRRLTAEQYRDSVLAVSGELNDQLYGPSIYPELQKEVLSTASRPNAAWGTSGREDASRRSIYVFVKRSLRVPLLAALDQPDPDLPCAERFPTNVPTQALMTLNSEFMQSTSERFAERLLREATTMNSQVELAIRLALARMPSPEEVTRHVDFIQSLQRQYALDAKAALSLFCLALFNLNEFMWID